MTSRPTRTLAVMSQFSKLWRRHLFAFILSLSSFVREHFTQELCFVDKPSRACHFQSSSSSLIRIPAVQSSALVLFTFYSLPFILLRSDLCFVLSSPLLPFPSELMTWLSPAGNYGSPFVSVVAATPACTALPNYWRRPLSGSLWMTRDLKLRIADTMAVHRPAI